MPIVGLSTGFPSSSASSSSTSLPQDTSGDTSSSPATKRSDARKIPESGNRLRDLPDWNEEFAENLEDKEVPTLRDTPANTSQDLDSERPTKVVSRKHSIETHFPKDRNCEICKRTKMTRAPCRRRTGGAVPRAANFGDLTTADHRSSQRRW